MEVLFFFVHYWPCWCTTLELDRADIPSRCTHGNPRSERVDPTYARPGRPTGLMTTEEQTARC